MRFEKIGPSFFLAALSALAAFLALAAPSLLSRRTGILRDGPSFRAETRERAQSVPSERSLLPPPGEVASLFGWNPKPAPLPGSGEQTPDRGMTPAVWIRHLGEVETYDGSLDIFFKDERSGRVLRVRRGDAPGHDDRLVEATPEYFTIAMDGGTYLVPRRR